MPRQTVAISNWKDQLLRPGEQKMNFPALSDIAAGKLSDLRDLEVR